MGKLHNSIAFKIQLTTILIMLVFSVIVGTIGYSIYDEAILDQYSAGAFKTAKTAAMSVDGKRINFYLQSGENSSEYMSVFAKLSALCNSQDAEFIYVIQPDTSDYRHITFVFSTVNSQSSFSPFEAGYVRETTNDDYRLKYRKLYEGESNQEIVVRVKGYIETDPHITAMIPIKGSGQKTTAILCVQRQMDVVVNARREYLKTAFITLICLVMLFTMIQSSFLERSLLRPVKRITDEASRFAEENTPADTKLTEIIRSKDEMGTLAESLDTLEERMQAYIKDITGITADKERILTELTLASQIQKGMLPGNFPAFPEREEIDIYAMMDPAREVGGDFYNYFFIDEDHLCIIMADVSGKGIPAALFMMAAMILLSNNAMMGMSPREIITNTNEAVCSNNSGEMFVTVWLGILEISTGKVTAVNAGHEYPVLMHAGGKYALIPDRHGFVVGGMAGIRYPEYEFVMEPGSRLFLYTDGVPEASDQDRNMFGTGRMLEALNKDLDSDPQTLLINVREAVNVFTGDCEQFDDLTMLCLEYKGNE